jgi:cell division protein FtsB
MPRRKVPLKKQHSQLVTKFAVWLGRLVRFTLIFGASALAANALIGEDGVLDTLKARQQHRILSEDLNRLRLENAELRQTADRLRHDPRAIEEVARRDLRLIKPGELLLLFAEDPKLSR